MTAIDHRQLDDVVAWLEGGHVGADLLDDSGRFMAQDAWVGRGKIALVVMQVAMADAGGLDFDQHLGPFGPVDFDLLDT